LADIVDGDVAQGVSEIGERANDAIAAPDGVVLDQFDRQFLQFRIHVGRNGKQQAFNNPGDSTRRMASADYFGSTARSVGDHGLLCPANLPEGVLNRQGEFRGVRPRKGESGGMIS